MLLRSTICCGGGRDGGFLLSSGDGGAGGKLDRGGSDILDPGISGNFPLGAVLPEVDRVGGGDLDGEGGNLREGNGGESGGDPPFGTDGKPLEGGGRFLPLGEDSTTRPNSAGRLLGGRGTCRNVDFLSGALISVRSFPRLTGSAGLFT